MPRGPNDEELPGAVLFACTLNSVRSPMAAGIMRHLFGRSVYVDSVGARAGELDPLAVDVMDEIGIEIGKHKPKSFDEFEDTSFDLVITLCDKVREVCPEFPDTPEALHWSVPDPATAPGTDDETYAVFERTAVDLEARITFLFHRLGIRGKE